MLPFSSLLIRLTFRRLFQLPSAGQSRQTLRPYQPDLTGAPATQNAVYAVGGQQGRRFAAFALAAVADIVLELTAHVDVWVLLLLGRACQSPTLPPLSPSPPSSLLEARCVCYSPLSLSVFLSLFPSVSLGVNASRCASGLARCAFSALRADVWAVIAPDWLSRVKTPLSCFIYFTIKVNLRDRKATKSGMESVPPMERTGFKKLQTANVKTVNTILFLLVYQSKINLIPI